MQPPMSTLSVSPAGSIAARAAVVLLVTLLAHAFVLQRVDTLLGRTEPAPAGEVAVISARVLPPPAPPPAAPARPSPPPAKPRPAPAVRRPAAPVVAPTAPAAPAAVQTRPEVEPAVAVDVGPDAFDAEPPLGQQTQASQETAETPAAEPLEKAATAGQPEESGTAAQAAPPFEATGEALHAALASLAGPQSALPATARYVYRTTNSELRIASGSSTVDWSLAADGQYRLRLATTAIGVTVLELQSEGTLRPFGLAPDRYTETRIRRGAVAANFDWGERRVTFSARPHHRPLDDGVQDRISFQFQLMLLGQAQPERFREGRQTVLRMAGRDDVFTYRFRSAGEAVTATGVGELQTVKIERIATDATDARIEVWLAPSLRWLPARLRFTDRYGRVTESVLESMPTS